MKKDTVCLMEKTSFHGLKLLSNFLVENAQNIKNHVETIIYNKLRIDPVPGKESA